MNMDVRVDKDFASLIPPLTDEEFAQLECNLIADGCRDPLVTWNDTLLDGHNRLHICNEHGIKYSVTSLDLTDRNAAKAWIIYNQFGRRNLTLFQRSVLALELEPLIARRGKGQQGTRTDLCQNSDKGLEPIDTKKEVARAAGVSHDTIAKTKYIQEKADEETKQKLRRGDTTIHAEHIKLKRAEKEAKREARRDENRAKIETTASPVETGAKFATIVIDPPWDWGDEGDKDQLGRARPTYGTMPIEQVAELPVSTLADDDCHLFLWITNRSLPKGFDLITTWGFRYVTCLTWCKPSFGMGNYFRGSTEHVLFAVKGSQPLKRKNVGTWFEAKRPRGHSIKPVEFFELVESCSPSPYLEMFARKERDGWVTWGAEV